MGSVGPFELLLVGLIALVAVGPKRLPEVARSLGKGVREFRAAMEEGHDDSPHRPGPPARPVEPGPRPPADPGAGQP